MSTGYARLVYPPGELDLEAGRDYGSPHLGQLEFQRLSNKIQLLIAGYGTGKTTVGARKTLAHMMLNRLDRHRHRSDLPAHRDAVRGDAGAARAGPHPRQGEPGRPREDLARADHHRPDERLPGRVLLGRQPHLVLREELLHRLVRRVGVVRRPRPDPAGPGPPAARKRQSRGCPGSSAGTST
ncbi:MAG: hypothetical protein M5U09_13715 [Gammaproteobacteria bacterium]|nr:hypothetical protein [Gammaproteobacteria bacterium]